MTLTRVERSLLDVWVRPSDDPDLARGYPFETLSGQDLFDAAVVAWEVFGRPSGEVAQRAVATWRNTGRWPTDMASLRIVLAETSRNGQAYGMDEDDLWDLMRVAVGVWDHHSLWVPPPLTEDWEDIWLYMCTCDGYRWLLENGITDYQAFTAQVVEDVESDSSERRSFEELRVAQFVVGRAWRHGGEVGLNRQDERQWLKLHRAVRRAWYRDGHDPATTRP